MTTRPRANQTAPSAVCPGGCGRAIGRLFEVAALALILLAASGCGTGIMTEVWWGTAAQTAPSAATWDAMMRVQNRIDELGSKVEDGTTSDQQKDEYQRLSKAMEVLFRVVTRKWGQAYGQRLRDPAVGRYVLRRIDAIRAYDASTRQQVAVSHIPNGAALLPAGGFRAKLKKK